jgi:hypothetical protein
MGGEWPTLCVISFAFCAGRVSEFSTWRLSAPILGLEKTLRDSGPENDGGRPATAAEGKIRSSHSLYSMKTRVNTTALTSEQVKYLTRLGEFQDDQAWVAGCDPDEFGEAMDLLNQAGIENVFVQFGGNCLVERL